MHHNQLQLNADKTERTESNTFTIDNTQLTFLTETRLRARGDDARCSDLTPAGYSIRSFPRTKPSPPPSLLTTLPLNSPVSLYLWPSSLSTSSVFIAPPPSPRLAARTSRLIICWLISSTACSNTVTLYGTSIVLGDFNVHYDNPLNPEWWISWPLLIWPRLSVSPLMTKDSSWTGCYTHLTIILCSLPPCLIPSPLTTPASSATSTSPFLAPDLRTSWREISAPSTALPWQQTWPRVCPTCLAPVLMTGLCADRRPWRPCSC